MVFVSSYKYLRGIAGPTGFSSASTAEEVVRKNPDSVKGKVIIVTGCNTGIGKETVRALAVGGAHVVLACRDAGRMKAAADEILKAHPEVKLTQLELDLTSFEAIRKFVKSFEALKLPLHILINNAAVMACPPSTTKDGIELQFGTNVVGHFLLTTLLLPILKTTGTKEDPARVINVASSAHNFARKGCFNDLSLKNYGYGGWDSYGRSKLGNVLFTRELSRRLQAEGANVRTYSLHPGAIPTDLQRSSYASQVLMRIPLGLWKSIPQGAATQTALAVLDDKLLTDGEYYADCNLWPSTAWGQDAEEAKKLWAQVESLLENPKQTNF